MDPAFITTDTSKPLPPSFAYQRTITFMDGNIDPGALEALYTITAAPICGFFAIPLVTLGGLYALVWALGRWEAHWAPLPPGVLPRTWGAFLSSLIPTLPKLPPLPKMPTIQEVKGFLWSLIPATLFGGVVAKGSPERPREAPKGPTPAQLRDDIDVTNDALLVVAHDDPSRPALLARLKDLRAALKAAEAPPPKRVETKEGEKKEGEERREDGERKPAPTWVGRRRQAWEDTLHYYSPMLEKVDIYCAIKNEVQKGLKIQVSKPTPLGGG